MRRSKEILLLICCATLLFGCRKNINVKIPDYVQRLVVEGKVETGSNPELFLTYTVPYFGDHTSQNISEIAVKNALVTVYDGFTTDTLKDATFGNGFYYRAANMIGVTGRTYHLTINLNGKTYTSSTTIYPPVALDSLWFKVVDKDSLGFVWAHFKEPSGLGNCYRWFAKRAVKDQDYVPPFNSAFDDKFFDGKEFDFAFDRGVRQNSTAPDDNNQERGFFKKNDVVTVKFCSIGEKECQFFRSYYANLISNGNPFAAPSNLKSNINGENVIGCWCGYSPTFKTLICQ